MKKIVILLFVLAMQSGHSQNAEKKDSVKLYKNEFGVNLLPLIIELGGANSGSLSKGNINYRRLISDKHMLRFSLGVNAFQTGPNNNIPIYYLSTDTFNVYSTVEYKNGIKPQVSIGYEFIFKRKKLIHSFGADLQFNYQHKEQKEIYSWAGKSSVIRSYSDLSMSSNNRVDSLGNNRTSDNISIGIQFFYNLRVPITKHWLISTTLGPQFSLNRAGVKNTDYSTGQLKSDVITNFDVNIVLSDLSIAFRF